MRERTVILLVCLLLSAVSGCLAPMDSSSEDSDQEQELPTPEYLPPRTEGPELPDVEYPNFQVRDCESITAGIVVPRTDVEATIPEAFEVRSLFSPSTTGISLRIERCEDALDNQTLYGSAQSFMALAQVRPVNESWGDGIHFYLLDVAADNLEFIDAVGKVHLEVEPAEVSFTKTPLPEDMFLASIGAEAEAWEFQMDFRYIPNMDQSLGHEMFLWYGSGPFHRMHETTAYESKAFVSFGGIVHDGDTTLASILPTPTYAYHGGSWRSDLSTLYQYDGAWT